jgi:hypothetical protein
MTPGSRARRLNLTVSGALAALADATPGRTASTLTRLLLRAAQVIGDARPNLSPQEHELVGGCLGDLLTLRPDDLPAPARLAAEVRDVIAQCDVWPAGVRARIVEWIAQWPLAAIWALADEIEGGLITRSAAAGAHVPRGRPPRADASTITC